MNLITETSIHLVTAIPGPVPPAIATARDQNFRDHSFGQRSTTTFLSV